MLMLQQVMQSEEEGAYIEDDFEPPPKPELGRLVTDIDQIVEFWGPRNTRMEEDRSLYQLARPANAENLDGEVVIKNTPYVVVEKIANLMTSNLPRIDKIPPENEDRERCQLVENFLRWSKGRWNRRWRRSQLQGSMDRVFVQDLALNGWAAGRLEYDEEDHARRDLPIGLVRYDPMNVYPAIGHDDGLRFVVHKYVLTVGEMLSDWPQLSAEYEGREQDEDVEIKAYYDSWWYALFIDDNPVIEPEEHGYGFIPWAIVTSGGAPIRGTTGGNEWTSSVGVSAFHGLKDSYRQLNRVLSQIADQVATASNPPILYRINPINREPERLDLEAGAINHIMLEEGVEPMNLSPNPNDIQPLLEALLDDISKAGLPPILWGTGLGQTGYSISLMTDAARDALMPIIEGVQELWGQVFEMELTIIRDFHEGDIGFVIRDEAGQLEGGLRINAEDIEMVGTEVEVRYRDVSPKDRGQMAQLAVMLSESNLISRETARDEYLNLENPSREDERVLTDLITQDEHIVKNVLVPLALYKSDPNMFQMWLMNKMMEMQQQQQGGMPPEGGPPGPPQGGPPPGMTGMAPMQGGGGFPGLPPEMAPPVGLPGANQFIQSLGSALGGASLGAGPPGIPGAGALPLGNSPLPLGL